MLIIVLLALIFVKMYFPSLVSKYAPLNITGTSQEPGDFFKLKNSLKCTPGPSADADYYSRTDTSGGVCGGQKFVNDQMRKFNIADM
jgi:hypothetical protein